MDSTFGDCAGMVRAVSACTPGLKHTHIHTHTYIIHAHTLCLDSEELTVA